MQKEYNYEYEEGRLIRATEADITLSDEIVTSKVIVNTVKYPAVAAYIARIIASIRSSARTAAAALVPIFPYIIKAAA